MSTPPKTLTGSECYLLLTHIQAAGSTPSQVRCSGRNYCMALLMLDAGLRVGELVALRQSNLSFASLPAESVVITAAISKNDAERTVPLSQRCITAIADMIQTWWTQNGPSFDHYAFYRTDPTHPITTRQVERIINQAALKAFNRPIHPHALRHTFATRLMKRTNARIVQQLLGHKRLTSTQVYTHPDQDDLKKAIDSINDEP